MKKITVAVLMFFVVLLLAAPLAQGPTPCLPPYKHCTPRPPIAQPKKLSLSF